MKNAIKLAAAALVVGLLTGCFSDLDDKNDEIIRTRLEAIQVEVTPNPVAAGDSLFLRVSMNGQVPWNGIWWNLGGPPRYEGWPSMTAPSKPGTYNYSVRVRLNGFYDVTKPFQVIVVP